MNIVETIWMVDGPDVEARRFSDPGRAKRYAHQMAHSGHDAYIWTTVLWCTMDGDSIVEIETMEAEAADV